eukprot:4891592-Pleurochrysis_carterae.AAC.1
MEHAAQVCAVASALRFPGPCCCCSDWQRPRCGRASPRATRALTDCVRCHRIDKPFTLKGCQSRPSYFAYVLKVVVLHFQMTASVLWIFSTHLAGASELSHRITQFHDIVMLREQRNLDHA